MPLRPTEADLLDLIEGSLPPARERELRSALASNSELGEQLRRMTQQRSMLRQLGESIDRAAPADLAEHAVLAARTRNLERMDRETSTTRELRRVPDDGRGARRRAMTIAATVALLVVGGWVWFLVGKVGPEGTANTWTRYERPWIEINENSRPVAAASDPAPDADAADEEVDPVDGVLADAKGATDPLRPDFVGPPVAPAGPGGTNSHHDLLDEWVANLDAGGAGETVDADRAGELLAVGKLRIVVDVEASAENRSRVIAAAKGRGGMLASALAQHAASESPPVRSTDAPSTVHTVVIALEPSRDRREMAGRLERLLADVSAATGVTARFEEAVPSEDPLAGLEASDLLWWSRPSNQWRTQSVLRAPVVFAGDRPVKPGTGR